MCSPWGGPSSPVEQDRKDDRLAQTRFSRLFPGARTYRRGPYFFLLSFGTTYHQLAIGLLASAVSWVLLILLLESAWRLVTPVLRYLGIESNEKAHSGR